MKLVIRMALVWLLTVGAAPVFAAGSFDPEPGNVVEVGDVDATLRAAATPNSAATALITQGTPLLVLWEQDAIIGTYLHVLSLTDGRAGYIAADLVNLKDPPLKLSSPDTVVPGPELCIGPRRVMSQFLALSDPDSQEHQQAMASRVSGYASLEELREDSVPAPEATVPQVHAVVAAMVACVNAGDFLGLAGLLSDGHIASLMGNQELLSTDLDILRSAPIAIDTRFRATLIAVTEVSLLSDGRIFATVTYTRRAMVEPVKAAIIVTYEDRGMLLDEAYLIERSAAPANCIDCGLNASRPVGDVLDPQLGPDAAGPYVPLLQRFILH